MAKLVRLWKRSCKNGREFKYVLIWRDEQGKERWEALGHADIKKAQRQCAQKERELRMGLVEPGSMRLSEFVEDSLIRTGRQIRESTHNECKSAMKSLIEATGDMDYRRIRHEHGERLVRMCLDAGRSPATAAKKVRHLKRLFQLAVDRGQLDENPLRRIKPPRSPKKKIVIFTPDECRQIIETARKTRGVFRWDLLILTALATGMRRGELLNAVWSDIDFENGTIEVSPKLDTEHTWEWHIKDSDRRTLPLTDTLVALLAAHQQRQPEGYPYVFVTPRRYDYIQQLRRESRWRSTHSRLKVVLNFSVRFHKILKQAGIPPRQFHDLRRTALSCWLANGMGEHDVMNLAGHASFSTTHEFYLATSADLLDRARKTSERTLDFIAISLQQAYNGVP